MRAVQDLHGTSYAAGWLLACGRHAEVAEIEKAGVRCTRSNGHLFIIRLAYSHCRTTICHTNSAPGVNDEEISGHLECKKQVWCTAKMQKAPAFRQYENP